MSCLANSVQFLIANNHYFISLKIKLDFKDSNNDDDVSYKTSAADELLVLTSEKRPTKIKRKETVTKILSRKQRKKLEKIVEKKKKKENVSIFLLTIMSENSFKFS
jgi:ATP-dependent RNA helicase DHX37/DHR1